MISFFFTRLNNKRIQSSLFVLSFLAFLTLIPLGVQQSKQSNVIIGQAIQQHGRGAYDLLVRPANTRTPIEKKEGIVEENYIGDSNGGISIKEWEAIKQLSDVDIAAPVASLGYFSGRRLQVQLPIFNEETRFKTQFFTSDGIHQYPISQLETFVLFKEKTASQELQYLKYPNLDMFADSRVMTVLMPPNYNLLVGIDPTSEEALTGISYNQLNEDVDTPAVQHILSNYPGTPILKVLQNEDVHVSLSLKLQVEKINAPIQEAFQQLQLQPNQWLMGHDQTEVASAYFQSISTLPATSSSSYQLDLSPFQKPFEGTAVQIQHDFKLTEEKNKKFFNQDNTFTYYVADKLSYKKSNNELSVSIVKNELPPIYKTISSKGGVSEELENQHKLPYFITQVGTFHSPKQNGKSLTSSPLGIYSTTPVLNEKNIPITPTITPGSFIPSPANGVTTLESAVLIKGNKLIDAIRIKIKGDSSYTPKMIKKIEHVAEYLLKRGYEVDIVAGSSFRPVHINVEGIGKVKESWTTLGVAQTLTTKWNIFTLVSTVLFLIFGTIFTISRINFEKGQAEIENQLLYNIGWTKLQIYKRNLFEQILFLLIGGSFSFIILALLKSTSSSYFLLGILMIVILVTMCILLWKDTPKHSTLNAPSLFPVTTYYRRLILPSFFILVISYLLITVQITYLLANIQLSQETTMGQYINTLSLGFHFALLIATILLGFLSVSETLLSLLVHRHSEIMLYETIGWTNKMTKKKLLKETMPWIILALLIGAILSFSLLILLKLPIILSLICISLVFTILILLLFILLTILIHTRLKAANK